jgi:hypothetical protein
MKAINHLALAMVAAIAAAPISRGGELGGIVIYANNWSTYSDGYGLYKFTPGYTVQADKVMSLTVASGAAGDIVDGRYCYVDFTANSSGTGATAANFNILNLDTQEIKTVALSDALSIATDMAYDVTTHTMFGCSAFASTLITLNLENGEAQSIASIPYMNAMACNEAGELYGISIDDDTSVGMLYRINKLTGESTLIGSTGVKAVGYFQSATFDKTNNRLYWVAPDSSGASSLYMVNTSTAVATYQASFANQEEFVGLYSKGAELAAGVPASVTDVTATAAADGSLSGTISFNAPTLTRGGEALSTLTKIAIYRGTAKTAVKEWTSVTPGASLSWTDTNAVAGYNTYRIVATNSVGDGMAAYASFYAGYDVPSAVNDLTVTLSDDTPNLKWSAPLVGLNGNVLDASQLKYSIKRTVGYDSETVATDLTATEWQDKSLNLAAQEYVSYTVTATSLGGAGKESSAHGIIAGPPYSLPFAESFPDCQMSMKPWISLQGWGTAYWELHYLSQFPGAGPSDNDAGMAVFRCFYQVDKSEAQLVSPAMTFENVTDPTLTFDFLFFKMDGVDMYDRIEVEVSTDGGTTFETVDGGVFVQSSRATQWAPCTVSLAKYKGAKRVQLSFHGYADHPDEIGADLSIDNIKVFDNAASVSDIIGGKDIQVNVIGQELVISNPDNTPINVYNIDGRLAFTSSASSIRQALTPAVYIVRAGDKAQKIVVK